jgi:anti-anti-sigma factor
MAIEATCSYTSTRYPVAMTPLSATEIGPDGNHLFTLVLETPPDPPATGSVSARERHCHGRLAGEIDYYAAECLYDVSNRIGSSGNVVHLDLSGVTFIDASGIGLLVRLRNHLFRTGGTLILDNVTPRTRLLLRLTGTGALLPPPGEVLSSAPAPAVHRDPIAVTSSSPAGGGSPRPSIASNRNLPPRTGTFHLEPEPSSDR